MIAMEAMRLHSLARLAECQNPLTLEDVPHPTAHRGELLLRVLACGVCHTELDEIEGRAPPARLPIILGHQIVGMVESAGPDIATSWLGKRVGVGWIASACGACPRCREGRENLCPHFVATGRDVDGGYAEYAVVRAEFAIAIPDAFEDAEAAPLLCAGAIGYRSLRLADLQNGQTLGLTGFGASAHLVLQIAHARYPDSPVFVFARSEAERQFALQLGAAWAGDIGADPPQSIDRIIDTTPVWRPVVEALRCLAPGGRLVINAIRKESTDQSALSDLDYARDLWMEKQIVSVANVTRADISEFLALAAEIGIRPEIQVFPLEQANRALLELHQRKIRGAKVLLCSR